MTSYGAFPDPPYAPIPGSPPLDDASAARRRGVAQRAALLLMCGVCATLLLSHTLSTPSPLRARSPAFGAASASASAGSPDILSVASPADAPRGARTSTFTTAAASLALAPSVPAGCAAFWIRPFCAKTCATVLPAERGYCHWGCYTSACAPAFCGASCGAACAAAGTAARYCERQCRYFGCGPSLFGYGQKAPTAGAPPPHVPAAARCASAKTAAAVCKRFCPSGKGLVSDICRWSCYTTVCAPHSVPKQTKALCEKRCEAAGGGRVGEVCESSCHYYES